MFKKLISKLPFSPSLAGQLGPYLQRLRREELSRRIGLILVVLAVLMQGIMLIWPPETQAAASNNDIIYGGITGKADLLRVYDQGKDSAGRTDIRQIYNYLGIHRSDIAAAQPGTVAPTDHGGEILTTGRYAYGLPGSKEQAVAVPPSTIYIRRLASFAAGIKNAAPSPVLIGHRGSDGGWFAVMLASGNVDITSVPQVKLPAATPPSAGKAAAKAHFVLSVSVANLTTATSNADGTTANPGDRLSYTLTVKNTGSATGTYVVKDTIGDLLEYTNVIDKGGASLTSMITNAKTNTNQDTLSWPAVSIPPGQSARNTFVVQVMSPVPANAMNPADPQSYNCTVSNTFGLTTNVLINCPLPKAIERISASLPPTGPIAVFAAAAVVLASAAYFHLRARQLAREVRLIRHDSNAGAI